MASSSTIKVMLSSRCDDYFPLPKTAKSKQLSEIRKQLKLEIENQQVLGKRLFEVWINETAPPIAADVDSWDACLAQVRDCDILVVLSNGNAGWAKSGGDIGICHAEYVAGMEAARGKVLLVSLGSNSTRAGSDGKLDRRFQDYVKTQSAFRGSTVSTPEQLIERVKEAVVSAVISLIQKGVQQAASSRFDTGHALDWTRMDFRTRKLAMEGVMSDALLNRVGSKSRSGSLTIKIAGTQVLTICHAIPAALSVAAARELVGRPFLLDHEHAKQLTSKVAGPLHIIACHKGATETQAAGLLGFPDATIVSGPFGIYVADKIQKIQFVFLVNCRDDSSTRHAIQRLFEWLEQTSEDQQLAARAASRAKIIQTIASEV